MARQRRESAKDQVVWHESCLVFIYGAVWQVGLSRKPYIELGGPLQIRDLERIFGPEDCDWCGRDNVYPTHRCPHGVDCVAGPITDPDRAGDLDYLQNLPLLCPTCETKRKLRLKSMN